MIRYILVGVLLTAAAVGLFAALEVQCAEHAVAKESATEEGRGFGQADTEPPPIPILCYHRFENTSSNTYVITPEAFEEQMEYLRENGFHLISLKEVADYLSGSRDSLPEKPTVITIDDGWKSGYTEAVPVLKEKGFRATFFVYTDFVSSCQNSLTWEDLGALMQDGFEVGSHSKSHPHFLTWRKELDRQEYRTRVREELEDSREVLEKKLNTSVALFSYPYGIYDSYLEDEIRECGYEVAVTVNPCPNSKDSNALRLSRFTILQEYTLDDFARIVASRMLLTEREMPEDSARIEAQRPLISARITDEGIDTSSLRMRLGETVLPATFDPETRELSYQITKDLKETAHIVSISARERATEKLTLASWLFIVDSQASKQ